MNKIVFLKVTLLALFFLSGCKEKEKESTPDIKEVDLIAESFPKAQQEVKAVLDSLFVSIQNRDIDELLSYHMYSDKFTEFRDQLKRTGPVENEEYERGLIKNISAFDYDLENLKIDVFDRVAIVTFNANFRPTIGENVVQLWRQGTLVFVKNNGVWRITHEHLSPLEVEES
ncbi:nuclear transport factor 2 family protein [Mangrovimonas sp. TPBH4]|uniref:nuclear transport factor 2 family protein n=1 Tax=Mangrovimonas sp. TPBH4 TaxID=1645914 RepID=UPI0006B43177|nr:nuclear transport factor 2 family protein [Mangrovimonas sp. TPBH4]